MELVILENLVLSIEAMLFGLELAFLIIIMVHMRKMRDEDGLLKVNIAELRTLHIELHESMKLLKEDIADLNETNKELQEFISIYGNQDEE